MHNYYSEIEFYQELNSEQNLQSFPTGNFPTETSENQVLGLILILDWKYGMAFNGRRQSKDSVIIDKIEQIVKNNTLYCEEYTAELFLDRPNIRIATEKPTKEPYFWFPELEDPAPLDKNITKIHAFYWDKSYPADVFCSWNPIAWELYHTRELKGSSHDFINYQEYRKL